MAMILEEIKPKRENSHGDYDIDMWSTDDAYIIVRQGDDRIATPHEDLPTLIVALQRVAELVLK